MCENMMLKEIYEEPFVFEYLINKYIKDGRVESFFPENFDEVKFVASGSSYNCARLGQKFFENIAKLKTSFEYSSEFNANQKRTVNKDVLYFFIIQSGETYDTKCALDLVNKNGGHTFSLVNNDNSYIYNNCEYKMNIEAGVEKSIAATKSFTGGVLCLWLLALAAAQNKGIDIKEYIFDVENIKEDTKFVIENTENIDNAADILAKLKSFPLIGYSYNYVIAKEGALKIKETSYIDVNAYPTGEFLHGHTAILNENSVILELFSHTMGEFERKTLEKIRRDYDPKIITVSDIECGQEDFSADICTTKGDTKCLTVLFKKFDNEIVTMLSSVIVLQLLALKIAVKLNRNVDKPIGLNKVVGES